MRSLYFLAAALTAIATPVAAATIDFGNAGSPTICSSTADGLGSITACGNFSAISQSYGDVAGLIDVTYSAPRVAIPSSLLWWGSNYNNLFGVAFAPGNDANSLARIEIKALQPGDAVTLSSFMLGAYSNTTRDTVLNIYAIGSSTPLFSYVGPVGNSTISATVFNPNLTVAGGLWIEWADSAYNVGIDNIEYSVGGVVQSVPEPSTWMMLLAGFGLIGFLRRRKVPLLA
jgi:PEP-CTERM motif